MSDRRDFDEFVVTRSSRLLRTAYLLTRDWALAEDLLQTALAKSWFASGRLGDDPEPWSFLVSIRCDKDMPESRMVSAEINGNPLMAGRCSGGVSTAGPAYGTEQARAESLGVRLGEPATVQVRVVAFTPGQKAAPEKQPVYRGALADYRVGVAVYSPLGSRDTGSPCPGGEPRCARPGEDRPRRARRPRRISPH